MHMAVSVNSHKFIKNEFIYICIFVYPVEDSRKRKKVGGID